MLYFLFIWMVLNIVALWITSYRIDAEACYDALIKFIINDNIILTTIHFTVAFAIYPFTIPVNIIKLLK